MDKLSMNNVKISLTLARISSYAYIKDSKSFQNCPDPEP